MNDKRIVILGECGHGDGRTFEIKSEIVRYLDSVGDYILVLEGMNPFDGLVLQDELPFSLTDSANMSIYYSWCSMWSMSKETSEIVKDMQNGDLDYWGMDCQPYYCNLWFVDYYKGILPNYDWDRLSKINHSIFANDSVITENDYAYYDDFLISIKNYWDNQKSSEYSDKHNLVINNAIAYSNQTKCGFSISDNDCVKCINEIRDKQMADNVVWYLNHNPEKKVIIWTANFHGAKDISQIRYGKEPNPNLYNEYTLLGEYLERMFPEQVYSVAFTSGSGSTGLIYSDESYSITPDTSSVEFALLQDGIEYGYIDFGSNPKLEDVPFHSILLGYHDKVGKWAKSFDAIFYVKKQHKAHEIEW